MTDTSQSEPLDLQPQTNGVNGLDEDERAKMRPADIDADVKEMERRKRVEMIMNSRLFREELERIIELQMDGNVPGGFLQQISDMMGIQSGKLHSSHIFKGSNCVTPINDIRGVESMSYAKGEKALRCKMASVFRLMDLYGWSQGIHNLVTARLNMDEENFLVNPHGILFNEITASSLVKVDMQGSIVEAGTTNFGVNGQGFLLHSAIHAARPDLKCIIHVHTPAVLAVSSLKCGLLPLCQEALVIGEVSQHPFVGAVFEPEEREKIIRNLGPSNKVLFLNNHGAVCCGATVEEAFYNVYNTVLACETQMKLIPVGVDNLVLVGDETRKQVYDAARRAPDPPPGSKQKQVRVGELEFEALVRMLDNAGFRTGYIYRHPLVKSEIPKPKNDVEVPPAVSSLGYLIEEEELYRSGNWKKFMDGRNRLDRSKWLNSPNVYQKVEILETGTPDPKKITKWVEQNSEEWVAEASPTHSSTPVKIESALQFVPKGTNPKEFKKLQQQIKINRLADKITSGPQSHILEGVSWEEAKKLQDANMTQIGDQVILVGAASKGIIQRNYQHNALVYKTPYAKNPFDCVSDKEIEDYKKLVERKQKGDTDYEESQSESEAISSSRQDVPRHIKSPLSPQSATSETEEESRDEPRVLRIETKTAPRPIQAEVVLSDAESDAVDARIERSQSARYPHPEKPESVTIINSFRKSWSLKRDKDKHRDVDDATTDRTNTDRADSGQQSLVVRLLDLPRPSTPELVTIQRSRSLESVKPYLARVKYMSEAQDSQDPKSPVGELFAELRGTLSDIRFPSAQDGDSEEDAPMYECMRWRQRPKFVCRSVPELHLKSLLASEVETEDEEPLRDSARDLEDVSVDEVENMALNSFRDCAECPTAAEDEQGSCTLTQTAADSTLSDWYYDKSLGNSQTVLHILDITEENQHEVNEQEARDLVRLNDTSVVEDGTDQRSQQSSPLANSVTQPVLTSCAAVDQNEKTEEMEKEHEGDGDGDGDSLAAANKSSETDSSFVRNSTSNDIDTSCAFKTSGTDNSEVKNNAHVTSTAPGTSYFYQEIEEDNGSHAEARSNHEATRLINIGSEATRLTNIQSEIALPAFSSEAGALLGWEQIRLPDIAESPEYQNVDTEDGPATSLSKDTSPEMEGAHSAAEKKEPKNPRTADTAAKGDKTKQKNKKQKSSTCITVKKELARGQTREPVVSEIKLTIKNQHDQYDQYVSHKYDVEIHDSSEEASRTASSFDGYESIEIVDDSCDCEAQHHLAELQTEVSTAVDKLHDIESYFEEEIEKASEMSCVDMNTQSPLKVVHVELNQIDLGVERNVVISDKSDRNSDAAVDLSDDNNNIGVADRGASSGRRGRSSKQDNASFNITIATPTRRDIFNYAENAAHSPRSFNLSSEGEPNSNGTNDRNPYPNLRRDDLPLILELDEFDLEN